ncbi:MAG: lipid A deacylase LpxR family protein [Gemmatimonadetes bacterium]|nr:lipid A deacylase LpxR family protein [Gemmatimonadota bacterium]
MADFQRLGCVALALLAAGLPDHVDGQGLQVVFDNDLIAPRGTGAPPDHDYTGGLRLAWVGGGGTRLSLVQETYTPRRDGEEPVPGERPYAGWLYAEWTAKAVGGERRGLRQAGVAVGLIGPPALGEAVQGLVHALTGSEPQAGWANQLRIGPTIQVRYRDGLRVALGPSEAWSLEPFGQFLLGNVRAGVGVGLPVLYRMDPELRASTGGFGAGLVVCGAWTAWDALLDRPPRGGSAVERIRRTGSVNAGFGYRSGSWAVAYSFTMRTREYTTQEEPHRFGTISLTLGW